MKGRKRVYKYSDYIEAAEMIRGKADRIPDTAVVLGSGMGELFSNGVHISYSSIPHFPKATAPTHKGELIITDKAVILSGRTHYYEGYEPEQLVFYVRVLKLLGIKKLILTNAAGGVNRSYSVGDIVLITDHIKLTSANALRGRNDENFGERFIDMTEAYSKRLRKSAHECAERLGIQLKDGVYFYMSGPNYETPAEIRAISVLGGDLVGMSTVHECIAARHCGIEVMGISCVTNMACGISDTPLSSDEVTAAAEANREKLTLFLNVLIERISGNDRV